VLCDVCGRNNADNLTFCQDCGRRLRQHRAVAPTPPNGLPKVELPAAAAAATELSPDSSRGSSPSGPPSAGRRARPAAPAFSFAPVEVAEAPRPTPHEHANGHRHAAAPAVEAAPRAAAAKGPVICADCGSQNPPEYRFCVTCGASLRRAVEQPAPAAAAPRPVEAAPRHVEAAPRPVEAAPRPRVEPAREAAPPRAVEPAADGEKIIGAPVVDIASSGSVPAKIVTCTRCHGQSVAGTRFCKFCGASLDEMAPSGRRPAIPPEPKPAPAPAQPAPAAAPVVHAAPAPVAQFAAAAPIASAAQAAPAAPPAPTARRGDPVGRVPLSPIGKPAARPAEEPAPAPAPKPAPARPAAPAAAKPPPLPPIARERETDEGTEVSELAGSPIPAEPVPLPARHVPGRWKGGRLVVIVEDGSEGRSFSLAEGQLDIGRSDGDIVLEDDPYVSPRHARLRRLDGSWILRDLDSTNHVYVRLRRPHILKDADLLLLGLEVLQFQTVSDGERGLGHAIQHGTFLFGSPATPRRARLCQRTVEGVIRDVYHVFRDETVIGREVGDIVFTADPFLSRRHAVIRRNPVTSEFSLVDLDSSNGTYVAIRGEIGLSDGDYLRIGQHLFRVDLG
jgi:pSer/pThr/pTyr-binding forkhead associated (FHA) protein